MDNESINRKFGGLYFASDKTFKMGIDRRITSKIAERFRDKVVLETCTGGGFTTIALAEYSAHVITVEIDEKNQNQAKQNLEIAGLKDSVKFILGDCINEKILLGIEIFDAAFLDPDWADIKEKHIYKFVNSNTKPPADQLLNTIMKFTSNIALILPPYIPEEEFRDLPLHEFQKIYLEKELALFCLYFGNLINRIGKTELYV